MYFVFPEKFQHHPPPPPPLPPHGGQRKFRGEGVPKGGNFRRGGGAYRGFFPGGQSKFGELLINNSFSVKKAISYFTVAGVSKTSIFVFSWNARKQSFSTFGNLFICEPERSRCKVLSHVTQGLVSNAAYGTYVKKKNQI